MAPQARHCIIIVWLLKLLVLLLLSGKNPYPTILVVVPYGKHNDLAVEVQHPCIIDVKCL